MATLDDSPSLFTGQTWVAWASHVEKHTNDAKEEDSVRDIKRDDSNSMKLRRKDMGLFGRCPAQDEFYLVVCERCGQVVKPQALRVHMEQRHKSFTTKTPAASVSSKPSVSKCSAARAVSSKTSLSEHAHSHHSPARSSAGSVTQPIKPKTSPALARAMQNAVIRMDKLPKQAPKVSSQVQPSEQKVITKNNGAPGPGKPPTESKGTSGAGVVTGGTTTTSTIPVATTIVSPSQVTFSSVPTTTTSAATVMMTTSATATTTTTTTYKPPQKEKILPCKDREFDPNKHCGVWITELSRQCTRSLTCKTHALSRRRAVPGRKKPFDELLKEHRAAKEALVKAKQEATAAASASSSKTVATSVTTPTTTAPTKTTPSPIASTVSSVSTTVVPKAHPVMSAPQPPMGPPKPGLLNRSCSGSHMPRRISMVELPREPLLLEEPPGLRSSEEEDEDEMPDGYDMLSQQHHPRPAMVNTFGARLHGGGCYVFNRKSDLLRAAFRATVDRHLHPPPHKKLCLESKLPLSAHMATDSKDPYEFNFVDTNASRNTQNPVFTSSNKQASKLKSKTPSSKVSKGKDSSSAKSPVGTAPLKLPSGSHHNASSKRKRSGSSPGPSGSSALNLSGTASAPISIAIPTGNINLSLSNSNLGSLAAANKPAQLSNRNNMLKDLSIVVTSIDPTLVNGQLVSIPSTNLAEGTHLQLNHLAAIEKSKSSRVRGSSGSKSHRSHSKVFGHELSSKTMNAVATTLTNTVGIVSSIGQQQTAILAPASFAAVIGSGPVMMTNNSVSSPATQESPSSSAPSPLRSDSSSPQLPSTEATTVQNGFVFPTSALKGFTVGLNHAPNSVGASPASSASSPSPVAEDGSLQTNNPPSKSGSSRSHGGTKQNSFKGHNHGQGKHSSKSSSQSSQRILTHPLNQVQGQQVAAAISLTMTQGGRFVPTTNNLQQMYTSLGNLGATAFSHIQIQPKQVTGSSGKSGEFNTQMPVQPISLTIPIVASTTLEGVTAPDAQSQTVFLQGTEQQQVANSPSNVLS